MEPIKYFESVQLLQGEECTKCHTHINVLDPSEAIFSDKLEALVCAHCGTSI